jgi:integrase/recombinase XerD
MARMRIVNEQPAFTPEPPSTTLLPVGVVPLRLAAASYLARFTGATRRAYELDLRAFTDWCAVMGVDPPAASRPMIELYVRWIQETRRYARATVARRLSTVCGLYRTLVIDGMLAARPAEYVRRPRRPTKSPTLGLTHLQFEAMLVHSRRAGPTPHAVIVLLGLLGLRVSEACAINLEDLGFEHGHRVVLVHGKGGTRTLMPLPPMVPPALDAAAGDRVTGPVLRTRTGARMDRHADARVVRRTAAASGIAQRVHPHVLRHAYVTIMLDAGVDLRDVQIAARHADPRTTMRYDRARKNLDRHPHYILAAYMASGT